MKKLFYNDHGSIQKRLTLTLSLLALSLSLLIIVTSFSINRKATNKRIREAFEANLEQVCTTANAELNKFRNLSTYYFSSSLIKDAISATKDNPRQAQVLEAEVFDMTWQYAAANNFEELNGLAIIGYDGFSFCHAWNYASLPSSYLPPKDNNYAQLLSPSAGQPVWLGLEDRQTGGTTRREIGLLRSIKNAHYTRDIGYVYISIDPRELSEQIFPSENDDTAVDILLLDGNNRIINADDMGEDTAWIETALGSTDAFFDGGYLDKKTASVYYVRNLEESGWKIAGRLPLAATTVEPQTIAVLPIAVILGCFLVVAGVLYITTRRIFKPLNELTGAMKLIQSGKTNTRIETKSDDEIGQLGNEFNRMLEELEQLHQQNINQQKTVYDAEYRALQAQVNPHFLFNTLNTVRFMAMMIHADNITSVVDAFWIITKYCTNNNDRFVTIQDELSIVQQYIKLQKIAYPERFDITYDVSPELYHHNCIKFFLQPLVENSLIHGILPRTEESGSIHLSIYTQQQWLVFNIHDDGVGMDEQTRAKILDPQWGKENKKAGLVNTISRIRYAYGGNCWFDISSTPGAYTNIMIGIPLNALPTADPDAETGGIPHEV